MALQNVVVILCIFLFFMILQAIGDELMYPLSSVYYDPATKIPLRITSIENVLMNSNYSTKSVLNRRPAVKIFRRIGYAARSNGCSCQDSTCGCCLGLNLNQFNFHREGCMNFTYIPDDFAIAMNMYMNGDTIFSQAVSGRNPPPACLPVPIPYIPINVQACAKVFNVYTIGNNIHLCFDFETHVQGATVLILHFDCMRLGLNGVALLKPEDGGGVLPTSSPPPVSAISVATEEPDDIYDDVTEVKKSAKNNNNTIGEVKLDGGK